MCQATNHLKPRDLSYLLPGLELIVSTNKPLSTELHNAMYRLWDTFVVQNLSRLEDQEKISGLALLSAYASAPLPFNAAFLRRSDAVDWLQQKWSIVWQSLLSSDSPLDLFALLRVLQQCNPIIPLRPCGELKRNVTRSALTTADLDAIVAKCHQDFNGETTSFIDFQLNLFTTPQLISLASTFILLPSVGENSSADEQCLEKYVVKVLDGSLSMLVERGVESLKSQDRRALYLDCLNLALHLNVRYNVNDAYLEDQ